MKITEFILIFIAISGYSQDKYSVKLSTRLTEIRELTEFNNGIVQFNRECGFPCWEPGEEYFQDDMVTYKYSTYAAVIDNKGQAPDNLPDKWRLVRGPHPYLFLRDTAKTEDLKTLLTSDHAYIRTYAFGALAYRKYGNLFDTVVNNLKDMTTITQFTDDELTDVYPVDLMIRYNIANFSQMQKDKLKELISTKYSHLSESLVLLEKK